MNRVGIIIAVEAEAHAILKSRELSFKKNDIGIWSSATYPFDLIISGVGKVLATHALMRLESIGEYSWYWSLGTSGSLGTEPIGSKYLCSTFVEWDMDIRPLGFPRGVTAYEKQNSPYYETMDKEMSEKIASSINCLQAIELSGDNFITQEDLSKSLKREFDKGLPLLVDMESAALAKVCCLRLNKPYCALRWVSDNANKESGNNWVSNVARASQDFADAIRTVGNLIMVQGKL